MGNFWTVCRKCGRAYSTTYYDGNCPHNAKQVEAGPGLVSAEVPTRKCTCSMEGLMKSGCLCGGK